MSGALAAIAAAASMVLGVATPALADDCANAAVRTGASAGLPDCRALERVSPAEKNGNNVSEIGQVLAAPVGGRTIFQTSGAFGQADGVPYFSAYAGFRDVDGWRTQRSDPPIDDVGFTNSVTLAYSDDGTRSLVVSRVALTPGATPDGSNVYVRDLTQSAAYTLVATKETGQLVNANIGGGGLYGDGTSDFSTLLLVSRIPLERGTAEGDTDNRTYQYRWTAAGGLEQIAALTSVPTGLADARTALSADGSRITAGRDDSNLYQYVGGTARRISRSRTAAPSNGSDAIPSADGRRVFFSSAQPLTTRSDDGRGSVYGWDADTDALTDLLVGVPGYDPQAASTSAALKAVSSDGQLLWMTSGYPLTADAAPDTTSLYLLDRRANAFEVVESSTALGDALRFSPNGRAVAIASVANLTDFDSTGPDCTSGICAQIFTYAADEAQPTLRCASCAGTPTGDAQFGAGGTAFAQPFTPITDDGRAFFDTPSRLTTEDANAVRDVYQYTPGVGAQLLSSGTGASPARFADAGADGQDVFFFTANPLVPADTDPQVDLYDARVGGGIAAQQVRPGATVRCRGDACRPAPSPQLPGSTIASALPVPAGPPKAPSFSVTKPSAKALRSAAREGRVVVTAKVGAAGTLSASLRGRLGGKRIRIAALDTVKAKRAGTVKLTLRLSRAARRALRRDGRLKLALTVGYSERTTRYRTTITLRTRTARSDRKGGRR